MWMPSDKGLSRAEAERLLERFGANEIPEKKTSA
jgi:Cation transporter/ATPase, N-terminus